MNNSSDFWGPPRPYRGYMFITEQEMRVITRRGRIADLIGIFDDAVRWPKIFGQVHSGGIPIYASRRDL